MNLEHSQADYRDSPGTGLRIEYSQEHDIDVVQVTLRELDSLKEQGLNPRLPEKLVAALSEGKSPTQEEIAGAVVAEFRAENYQRLSDEVAIEWMARREDVLAKLSTLGFSIQSRSVRMRTKSKEKFQNKIKEITRRSNNLDQEVINKLNRVIRGTVNYFGAKFSTVSGELYKLDRWIRKRIRCMKYKRIWRTDNWRVRIKLTKKMGLLSCYDLYKAKLQC